MKKLAVLVLVMLAGCSWMKIPTSSTSPATPITAPILAPVVAPVAPVATPTPIVVAPVPAVPAPWQQTIIATLFKAERRASGTANDPAFASYITASNKVLADVWTGDQTTANSDLMDLAFEVMSLPQHIVAPTVTPAPVPAVKALSPLPTELRLAPTAPIEVPAASPVAPPILPKGLPPVTK